MQYNLEGRAFRAISNTNNGEVGPDTLFHDRQTADVVTATTGGASSSVTSFAKILTDGRLDMRYHHLNNQREFMLGKCISTPERLSDGRLRFTEHWQWLPGDMSSGHSETEEVERKAFVQMVLELAVLDVIPGTEREFERSFATAKGIIASMPGFVSLELQRCLETPTRYALLVRWQRLEDHTEGFRKSPQYERWKELLHHFYRPFPKVEHYQESDV